jgi:hypothetical protein
MAELIGRLAEMGSSIMEIGEVIAETDQPR